MFVVKETSNPITDATQGINGLKIDHVAIFHHTDSADYALEAYGKAVSLIPLTKFLDRAKGKEGKPLIAVGRVIVDCDMATSMSRALSYLGRPYDHFYMPDDKEIYCSELVQKSFVDHHGLPVFPTIPMSFHDKDGKTHGSTSMLSIIVKYPKENLAPTPDSCHVTKQLRLLTTLRLQLHNNLSISLWCWVVNIRC